MAGRADFRIDLEAALQLLVVELAERPVAGETQVLGLAVELFARRLAGGLAEVGRDAAEQRDQQDDGEDGADEAEDETHVLACPLIRPLP